MSCNNRVDLKIWYKNIYPVIIFCHAKVKQMRTNCRYCGKYIKSIGCLIWRYWCFSITNSLYTSWHGNLFFKPAKGTVTEEEMCSSNSLQTLPSCEGHMLFFACNHRVQHTTSAIFIKERISFAKAFKKDKPLQKCP